MTLHEDWHKAHPGYPCEYHTCPQGQVLDVVTPDLPADKPKWADLFGIDPTYTGDATPDLPIPEEAAAAAIEDIAKALFPRYWGDYGRYVDPEPMRDMARAEARTALAAALPHLRSLQVETQVEYGRALGRKEALDDVGRGLGCVLQTHETYVDIQMDAGLWRDIAATRDADRKLAVDDRSLQERQNLLRVPTHDIDGNRIPEWEREYIARDIGKGDPNG